MRGSATRSTPLARRPSTAAGARGADRRPRVEPCRLLHRSAVRGGPPGAPPTRARSEHGEAHGGHQTPDFKVPIDDPQATEPHHDGDRHHREPLDERLVRQPQPTPSDRHVSQDRRPSGVAIGGLIADPEPRGTAGSPRSSPLRHRSRDRTPRGPRRCGPATPPSTVAVLVQTEADRSGVDAPFAAEVAHGEQPSTSPKRPMR